MTKLHPKQSQFLATLLKPINETEERKNSPIRVFDIENEIPKNLNLNIANSKAGTFQYTIWDFINPPKELANKLTADVRMNATGFNLKLLVLEPVDFEVTKFTLRLYF